MSKTISQLTNRELTNKRKVDNLRCVLHTDSCWRQEAFARARRQNARDSFFTRLNYTASTEIAVESARGLSHTACIRAPSSARSYYRSGRRCCRFGVPGEGSENAERGVVSCVTCRTDGVTAERNEYGGRGRCGTSTRRSCGSLISLCSLRRI